MTLNTKVLASGLLLAVLNSVASAESFLRPVLSYDSPTTDGFSSTVGYGFVAGSALGDRQEHELSFEWHYNRWDYSATYAGFTVSGHESNMPFLVNYRYRFGSSADKVRFYCGPALGLTATRISVAAAAGGFSTDVRNSDWSFSWSGSAGLLIRFTEKTDLDIGYRYLRTEGRDFKVGTTAVSVDERATHIFYSGFNIRF